MQYGIISDVHANLPSLLVVLDFLKSKNVGKVIHSGDVVGYNAFPSQVIDIFRKEKILTIAGNHDRGIIGLENLSWFNPEARQVIIWTRKMIGNERIEYIKCLAQKERFIEDNKRIVLVHGHPNDSNHYTWEDEIDETILEDTNTEILILGHTHVPFIKKMKNGIVINPGSVGQPRDGDIKTSCAILNTQNMKAEIFRLKYPIQKTIDANLKAGLPLFFTERLQNGI